MSKMKRIQLEPVPKTIFGKPFRIADIDQEPPAEVYRCEKCGSESEIVKPVMVEKADLGQLLKLLILNIPRQSCTMQDSINAFDYMQQMGESENGVLKVTDGIHTWLVDTAKKHGMAIFGVNTGAIVSALDNLKKEKD